MIKKRIHSDFSVHKFVYFRDRIRGLQGPHRKPLCAGESACAPVLRVRQRRCEHRRWLCQLGAGRGIYDLPPLWEAHEIPGSDPVGYGV